MLQLPHIIQNKIIHYCWDLTWLGGELYQTKDALALGFVSWHWFEQCKIKYNQREKKQFNPYKLNVDQYTSHTKSRYCVVDAPNCLLLEKSEDNISYSIYSILASNVSSAWKYLVGDQLSQFNKAMLSGAKKYGENSATSYFFDEIDTIIVRSHTLAPFEKRDATGNISQIIALLAKYKSENIDKPSCRPIRNVTLSLRTEGISDIIRALLPIRDTIVSLDIPYTTNLDPFVKQAQSLRDLTITLETQVQTLRPFIKSIPPTVRLLHIRVSLTTDLPWDAMQESLTNITSLAIQDPSLKGEDYLNFLYNNNSITALPIYNTYHIETFPVSAKVLAEKTNIKMMNLNVICENDIVLHKEFEYLSLTLIEGKNVNNYAEFTNLRDLYLNYASAIPQEHIDQLKELLEVNEKMDKLSIKANCNTEQASKLSLKPFFEVLAKSSVKRAHFCLWESNIDADKQWMVEIFDIVSPNFTFCMTLHKGFVLNKIYQ